MTTMRSCSNPPGQLSVEDLPLAQRPAPQSKGTLAGRKKRTVSKRNPASRDSEFPPEVGEYLDLVEHGQFRVCKEQTALVKLVRHAFETEDIYVDEDQLSKYLRLERYFPFRLFPWEKFLTALWDCTYWRETGLPRWPTVLCLVGRGAGKDAFISFSSMCSISPYCEAARYDVDICANEEEQASRPLADLVDVLEDPDQSEKLGRFFYHTKKVVQGKKNRGSVRGRTNNPKSRDGMRTGKAVFNEIHQYENYNNITVFRTGLGKTVHPRIGYFSSNGTVSDGPLDDLIGRSRRILFEGEADRGFLPFICALEDRTQVEDPANWYMANPSLQYRPELLHEIQAEYEDWLEAPAENPDFLTKRMGLRAQAAEIAVTDYDKILATNRPLPDLRGWSCTVGIDYAELSDWAAVNLHFRRGDERFDINHAWLCTSSKTLPRVRVPWRDWASNGDLTVVDDVSIHPDLLAEWVQAAGRLYNIKGLAMDNYRWTLVSTSFQNVGFDLTSKKNVKLIRPSDIMKVDPVIQACFDRGLFTWGNVHHLRWAVNNTKRVRSSRSAGVDTGNFIYAKIEAKSRKTDPFMALAASMVIEPLLGGGSGPAKKPPAAVVW